MADLKAELETWTDEVEGNLEKRKICGIPVTRKVTVPILILFLTSVFIIGVVFGAKEGKHKSGSPLESTGEVTNTNNGGDLTDTIANTNGLRYEQVLEIIEPLVGSVVNFSPEHRALNWLANIDPAKLDFEDTDLDQLLQRYVLTVIYFATGGENWEYQYNFLSGDNVCDWNMEIEKEVWGASCFDHEHVGNLYLEDNNLEGTIPKDIGLIPKLEYLGLKGNSLSGGLPSTFGLLTNLIKMDIRKYDIC
jgi:Leucine-rich repeat (LRR) protein